MAKPLKRSKQLTSLSHEHHEILLFVWKIRQGMIYGVDAGTIGKYCQWFWNSQLKDHFQKEETVFPAALPEDDVLMNNMKEDHAAIQAKFDQIVNDPYYFQIQRLAQILEYHIRFEERTWFPYVERTLTPEKLDNIEKLLRSSKTKAAPWPDEFWIRRSQAS